MAALRHGMACVDVRAIIYRVASHAGNDPEDFTLKGVSEPGRN